MLFTLSLLVSDWGAEFIYLRMELQHESGIKELTNVRRLRPALYAGIVVLILVILPLSQTASLSPIVSSLYFASYGVVVLVIIIFGTYFGWKLSKIFKRIWKKTKVKKFKLFLGKVGDTHGQLLMLQLTKYIWGLDISLICAFVTLVTYSSTNPSGNKWLFLSLQTLLRLCEIGSNELNSIDRFRSNWFVLVVHK